MNGPARTRASLSTGGLGHLCFIVVYLASACIDHEWRRCIHCHRDADRCVPGYALVLAGHLVKCIVAYILGIGSQRFGTPLQHRNVQTTTAHQNCTSSSLSRLLARSWKRIFARSKIFCISHYIPCEESNAHGLGFCLTSFVLRFADTPGACAERARELDWTTAHNISDRHLALNNL